MSEAIYNKIGKTYDMTRHADTGIVNKLMTLLDAKPRGRYLDIACGSGNYTHALTEHGLEMDGIDISKEMLNKAR